MTKITDKQRAALLETFDRYSSGRSLNAIYECENLDIYEQSVLQYIGHSASFKTNGFVSFKPHKMETLAKKARISTDKTRRVIKDLQEKGYLKRVRRIAQSGAELTPEYAMTYKIFREYEDKWVQKAVDSSSNEGLAASHPPEDDSADEAQKPDQNDETPLPAARTLLADSKPPPCQQPGAPLPAASPVLTSLNLTSPVFNQSSCGGEDARMRDSAKEDTTTTGWAGNLSLARMIQFSRDNFDPVFAREGVSRQQSLGFDFEEANEAVVAVVDQIGFDRAEEFARWLLQYKAYVRRLQIKPREIPGLLKRFLSGMEIAQ